MMLDDLKKKWDKENCRSIPASEDEVRGFEQAKSIQLPTDFRNYLLELNGTVENGDAQIFEFYPLDKLKAWDESDWVIPKNTPSWFKPEEFFIFADYLISCWAYAVRLSANKNDGGLIVVLGGTNFIVAANTFTDFIELYLADNKQIYAPFSAK